MRSHRGTFPPAFTRRTRKTQSKNAAAQSLEQRLLLTVEVEPNNLLADATPFTTDNDTLEGTVSDVNDFDFFVASFSRGDTLEIETPNINNTTFTNAPIPAVAILDADGEVKSESLDERRLRFTIPYTGDFYVRIDSSTLVGPKTGDYAMQTTVSTLGDSTSEVEPNDDTASATDTEGRAHISGDLSSGNAQDYYRFRGNDGETAFINFSDTPDKNPTVRLYSPGGQLRAENLEGLGLSHVLDETGDWFVEIGGDNVAGPVVGGYVARIDTVTAVQESGSNIDFTTATPWDLEADPWVAGTLTSLDEPKVFSFEITDFDIPRFWWNDSDFLSLQNREMAVYNEQGQYLQHNYDGQLNRRSSNQPIHVGTYYLVLSASSEAGLGPFAVRRAMSQAFSYERDKPLYFLDFTEQVSHLGWEWVNPFSDLEKVPLARALFESRYDIFNVDVTEDLPGPEVGEYVGQGIGDFGDIGAGGWGGGNYGTRRPNGDGVTGNDGSNWNSLAGGSPVPTLIHEAGHATGLAHSRHPLSVMSYTNSAETFPIGSYFPFTWTDQHNSSPSTINVRDYLDWALTPGAQVFESESNDTPGEAENLSVFINSMSFSYQSAADVITQTHPGAVRLGKLNADDVLDVVYTDIESDSILVRMGNGDGTFGGATVYSSGGDDVWWSKSLALADYDGDGDLDIAHSNYDSQNLVVLINNGAGAFGGSTSYSTLGSADAIEAADFTGDGAPDIVLGGSGFVRLMVNNGDATFSAPVTYDLATTAIDIHPVDLNRDTRNDLVTANADGTVSVLMNVGGAFTLDSFPISVAQLRSVTAGDFDGDGVEDVAVVDSANMVYMLEGDDLGGLTVASTIGTNNEPWELDAIDMNLDGLPDLVVSSLDERSLVLPSSGDLRHFGGSFEIGKAGQGNTSQDLGDLNGDGFPDLISSNDLVDRLFVSLSEELSDEDNDRVVVYGELDSRDDVDMYSFTAYPGETWVFDIDAAEYQYGLDSSLTLYDADGNIVASNANARDRDTGIDSVDPWLEYTVTERGPYFLSVSSEFSSRGNYRLKALPSTLRDDEGPRILYTTPQPGSTIDSTRQLLFFTNDQIDPQTLDNIEVVGANSGAQAGSATFDPIEQVIIWTADAPLPNDAYSVRVTSRVTDLAGNALDGETDGLPAFPEVSGDDVPGGDYETSFIVNGTDNSAATVGPVDVWRHFYNRHRIRLQASDELDIPSVQNAEFTLRGAGADAVMGTADDTLMPLDVLNQTYQQNNRVVVYTRGVADPGQYEVSATVLDAAGHTVVINVPVSIGQETRYHGPSVIGMSPMPGGTSLAATDRVEVHFSGALDETTITSDNLKLIYSESGDFLDGTAVTLAGLNLEWDATRNTVGFVSTDTIPNGYYRVDLNSGSGGITNVDGHALDGEFLDSYIPGTTVPSVWQNAPSGDGRPGGDYSAEFVVAVPEIEVDLSIPEIVEDAGPAAFEITLNRYNSDITSPLTVTVSSSDTSEIALPATITFDPFETEVSVPVDVVDDFLIDGTITVLITVSAAGFLDGAETIDVLDNEVAGVVVVESDTTTVVQENGTSDSFEVTLTAEPLSEVVLTVVSSDTSEATTSVASLTFAPAEWNVPQVVTVTGQDDPTVDGDILSNIVIAVDDLNSDDQFDGLADSTVAVTTIDDDMAAFDITETDTTVVDESGTTDTFSVVLPVQPVADVVLSVSSPDLGEVTVSPGTLTFTSANWDQVQTVTVTGQDDNAADGDVTTNVVVRVVDALSDNAFDGLPNQIVVVTTTDDEEAAFVVTESAGQTIVSEAGLSDSLTVSLPVRPVSSVVISVTSPDTTELLSAPARLTFTPGNWATPQTIIVQGPDDDILDGSQSTGLVLSIVDSESSDAFDDLTDQTIFVTTLDDDGAALEVSETFGTTTVSETGSTDLITVRLPVQPLGNVVLGVSSSDTGEVTASTPKLTFTPSNWNVQQTVVLRGIDDDAVDGDQQSDIVLKVIDDETHDSFDGVADLTVVATTTDDEIADFVITLSQGPISVSETGAPGEFHVRLADEPTGDVVLTVSSSDLTEVTVSPSTLTFTPLNWNDPQAVTVSGVEDSVVDGDQVTGVVVSVLDSESHDAFDNVEDQSVVLTVTDEQVAAFAVNQTQGVTSVSEAGDDDSFTVALVDGPLSDVVFEISSSDVTEGTVSLSRLTFTPGNWSTPQSVLVTGVNDPAVDGDQVFDVTVSVVSAESNAFFAGLADQTVVVTNADDDVASYTVAESGSGTIVTEAGSEDQFSVSLPVQPVTDVVFTVTSFDRSEAVVSSSLLTFTPGNWDTAQTVTVTGVDDSIVDGDQVTDIAIVLVDSLSDDAFDGLASTIVSVMTINDDLPSFAVVETDGSTMVSEDGSITDSFDVVLPVEPVSPVIFELIASDSSEVETSLGLLTFDSQNWSLPQTVSVTGVDDDAVDGTVPSSITVSVWDEQSDSLFHSLADQTVSVSTIDDDIPALNVVETNGFTRTRESGTTDEIIVSLAKEPAGVVMIAVNTSSTDITTSESLLTFTPANWEVGQALNVASVDDTAMDGSQFVTVNLSVDTAQSVASYHAAPAIDVEVLSVDDDSPVYLDRDILYVNGTDNQDTIVLMELGDQVEVEVNGDIYTFDLDDFRKIRLKSYKANDLIDGRSMTKPIHASLANGRDEFHGGSGSDTVNGGGGYDLIHGNDGNDRLGAGNGWDTVFGGEGNDRIRGGGQPDLLEGEAGNDNIGGGGGRDTAMGGGGDDYIFGDQNRDTLHGDDGHDTLLGGAGSDSLKGGNGHDLLDGGNLDDVIKGDLGRDLLIGGKGVDDLDAGSGEDILIGGYSLVGMAGLESIHEEWVSDRAYDERVANIVDSGAVTPNRKNSAFLIGADRPSLRTLVNDGDIDGMAGEGGSDLFFASLVDDVLEDRELSEWLYEL